MPHALPEEGAGDGGGGGGGVGRRRRLREIDEEETLGGAVTPTEGPRRHQEDGENCEEVSGERQGPR